MADLGDFISGLLGYGPNNNPNPTPLDTPPSFNATSPQSLGSSPLSAAMSIPSGIVPPMHSLTAIAGSIPTNGVPPVNFSDSLAGQFPSENNLRPIGLAQANNMMALGYARNPQGVGPGTPIAQANVPMLNSAATIPTNGVSPGNIPGLASALANLIPAFTKQAGGQLDPEIAARVNANTSGLNSASSIPIVYNGPRSLSPTATPNGNVPYPPVRPAELNSSVNPVANVPLPPVRPTNLGVTPSAPLRSNGIQPQYPGRNITVRPPQGFYNNPQAIVPMGGIGRNPLARNQY